MPDKTKDFWAGTAAPPQQGTQSSSAPAADDGWKLWQQEGDAPTGDQRNGIQKKFDSDFADVTPQERSLNGPVVSDIAQAGKSAGRTLLSPFIHPIQALGGLMDTGKEIGKVAFSPSPQAAATEDLAGPDRGPLSRQIHGVSNDFKTMPTDQAISKTVGTAAGMYAGGKGAGEAGGAGAELVRPLAAPLERFGMDTLNSYAGQTLPMIKRGQSPAAALIDEGLVPAMSRHSLSRGVDNAMSARGADIGSIVRNSNATIPSSSVTAAIEKPIMHAGDVASGFGGTGRVDPIADLWAQSEHPAPGAGPIYGPRAPANVPASDVWASIKNMDKNTRFNPDPEVEGVNELRRDIRGGLRPQLNAAVPGLEDLSGRYSNLAAAQEGLERTSRPGKVGKISDMFGTPLTTGAGAALVRGGRLAGRADAVTAPLAGSAFLAAQQAPGNAYTQAIEKPRKTPVWAQEK